MNESRDTELGERLEIARRAGPRAGLLGPDARAGRRGAAERRQPGLARRVRAAFGTRTAARRGRRRGLVAAVAAAVLIGLPRTPGPETVSAAVVLERALSAVSSGRTWQADVMMKAADWNRSLVGHHYDLWRYHLVQSADGSYLLTQLGPTRRLGSGAAPRRRVTDVVAYDAATGVLRHLRPGRGLVGDAQRPAGAAGPLGRRSPASTSAPPRALQAVGAVTLEKTEIDGRRPGR